VSPALPAERERLGHLLRTHSLMFGDFALASGRRSRFYFDSKRTTLTAEGAYLAASEILRTIRERSIEADAIGGMTLGADPLVCPVAALSHLAGRPLRAFIVRKEPKGHGTGQWIEGRRTIPDGSRVVVIEDVVTTGGSALKAIERCRAEALVPVACLALVDRREGGREAIEAQGVPLDAVFAREDFVR